MVLQDGCVDPLVEKTDLTKHAILIDGVTVLYQRQYPRTMETVVWVWYFVLWTIKIITMLSCRKTATVLDLLESPTMLNKFYGTITMPMIYPRLPLRYQYTWRGVNFLCWWMASCMLTFVTKALMPHNRVVLVFILLKFQPKLSLQILAFNPILQQMMPQDCQLCPFDPVVNQIGQHLVLQFLTQG